MSFSIPLHNYWLLYEITVPPHILFCELTPATKYFKFDQWEVPMELKHLPIDCRFAIFNPDRSLNQMVIKQVHSDTLTYTLNIEPLKLIKHVLEQNKVQPGT